MTTPKRLYCCTRSRRFAPAGTFVLLAAALAVAAAPAAAQRSPRDERRVRAVVKPTTDFSKPERYEERPGGAATVFKILNRDAFSHPSANIGYDGEFRFKIGNGVFRKLWVTAPSSTTSSDGLGPLFNARSCQGCHIKDGRGNPPHKAGDVAVSMLIRLSIPPRNEAERALLKSGRVPTIGDPVYGRQLQTFAIGSLPAEGNVVITYTALPVRMGDGTVVTLRKPSYRIVGLGYGPLHPKVMISPRIAPQMIGLGLLEAIPEKDIAALADPDDRDGDGISGRMRRTWSVVHRKMMLGRFGWKGGTPSVAEQSAAAFVGDIGISNPLNRSHAGECTPAQTRCLKAPHGAAPAKGKAAKADAAEINRTLFDLVVHYSRNLGVPARRKLRDPQVLKGKALFYRIGCTGCHRPKFVTARLKDRKAQSFQLIWPYTDMLLHDMGPGLADDRPEGNASGREWRTAPLWGIGLTKLVNGHTLFLHDGRARNLTEAILWHGGEAEASRDAFRGLSAAERAAVIAFIESL